MRCPRRACLTLLALAAPASAQCTPDWDDRFCHPDFDRPAYSTLVFDDGTGPALYAGGNFKEAGTTPASLVAKWDGSRWFPVGALGSTTTTTDYVTLLAAHDDDGPGPHPPTLYASGNITTTIPGAGIVRWNGLSWVPIPDSPRASVMASIDDDGPGPLSPALYIGGNFTSAGGIDAYGIVRWDGQTWSPVGSGLVGGAFATDVRAIIRHDEDGPGPLAPRLFAGGSFGFAGGQPALNVAAWDGQNWSPLGGGMTDSVNAFLELDEDGPGPQTPSLIAAGNFALTNGFPSNGAARWKNGAWSALGSGPGTGTGTMVLFDADGPGPAAAQLVARQSTRLTAWNGASWSPIPGTFSQAMSSSSLPPIQGLSSLAVFTPINALPILVVSGNFRRVDSTALYHIARFDNGLWGPLRSGLGLTLPNQGVSGATLAMFDEDGPGPGQPALFAGGPFISAGTAALSGFARLTPVGDWTAVGAPLTAGTQATSSLVFDDDGPGPNAPALYVALTSYPGGSATVVNVARWDGVAWSTLGSVTAGTPEYHFLNALASFDDDGPGPNPARLYAGGENLVNGSCVARWDGATWSPVGTGIYVYALAEFDADGPGPQLPQLYAGAHGSAIHSGFYKLENGAWVLAGGGIAGPYQAVRALAVMDDDGPGPILPALYVGGTFDRAGEVLTPEIARFNGTSWTSPAGGLEFPLSIEYGAYSLLPVDEDGPGAATPVLYVGGLFSIAGGMPAKCIARWNPASASWSSLGAGINNPVIIATVNDLAWIDRGPIAGLFAAGKFSRAGNLLSSNIAHWACGTRCYNNCDASTISPILNVNDFICFMNSYAAGQTYANCDQSTVPPVLNVNDFACFMNRYAAGCP